MKLKHDPNDLFVLIIVLYIYIWGEHPGVCIIVYEHDVHLKFNYEL